MREGGFITGLLLLLAAGRAIRFASPFGHRSSGLATNYHLSSAKRENTTIKSPLIPGSWKRTTGRSATHSEEVKAARSPERLAEFQYKLLLDVLRRTSPHDGNGSRAKRGWAEAQFGDRLNRYFPAKIHTGLTLKIPDYGYPYTPDFAYIDQALNLYIDAEIDEPYVYEKGEPTHYLGSRKDENRNQFFFEQRHRL